MGISYFYKKITMSLKMFCFLMALAGIFVTCDSPHPEHMDMDEQQAPASRPEYVLVIHGGAGVILREDLSDSLEAEYRAALNAALDAGEKILKEGGLALDAIVAAVQTMEDNPLFNAGRGAVFTHDGKNEMDASIMDGRDLNAGSVGGLTNIKSPIAAARAVMEKSEHVFLTGRGAEQFAAEQGLEVVDPSYFYTERRWKSLQQAIEAEKKQEAMTPEMKHGTVGAVALDKFGNVAAAPSTGGMTNKHYNGFGDVPVIGAGTYANNLAGAISCTGHGEFFIRYTVAHDIAAVKMYQHKSLEEAAHEVIFDKMGIAGGEGGIIAVDPQGNFAMVFNSPGMYRGYTKPDKREVKIFKD